MIAAEIVIEAFVDGQPIACVVGSGAAGYDGRSCKPIRPFIQLLDLPVGVRIARKGCPRLPARCGSGLKGLSAGNVEKLHAPSRRVQNDGVTGQEARSRKTCRGLLE